MVRESRSGGVLGLAIEYRLDDLLNVFKIFYGRAGKSRMKKPKPKKLRKVWLIKPQSRIRTSSKRQTLERIKKRELRDGY